MIFWVNECWAAVYPKAAAKPPRASVIKPDAILSGVLIGDLLMSAAASVSIPPIPLPARNALRRPSKLDDALTEAGRALQILSGTAQASRPNPAGSAGLVGREGSQTDSQTVSAPLTARQRRHAAGLMRVNHTGEICAQALYRGQALGCRGTESNQQNATAHAVFHQAAAEEVDHLVWCQQRLRELDSRPSLLNPLWYAASFALGMLASKAGVARNLGFMAETERQVSAHLAEHLRTLPEQDLRSRAIVAQMQIDEEHHRHTAETHGGQALPPCAQTAMKVMSRIMTTTAYSI